MCGNVKSYCFLSAGNTEPHKGDEFEQKQCDYEGVCCGGCNCKDLYEELSWITEEQSICSRTIDHLLSKHACQYCTSQTSHTMRSPDIERVVNLRPLGTEKQHQVGHTTA